MGWAQAGLGPYIPPIFKTCLNIYPNFKELWPGGLERSPGTSGAILSDFERTTYHILVRSSMVLRVNSLEVQRGGLTT